MNAPKPIRDEDINFGDRTKLSGPQTKSLAIVTLPGSRPLTLYADAKLSGPAAAVARVVPLVTVEWGAGTATVRAEYRIAGRLRVPLVARTVKVDGRLVGLAGQPPPADVTAEVSAFLACGIDGESLPTTRLVLQSGAGDVVSRSSERVLAVDGHNGGSTDVWIMLFEGTSGPSPGDTPRMAAPVAVGGTFRMRPASPREFVGGVRWAASATPLSFTPAVSAALFVEVELLP